MTAADRLNVEIMDALARTPIESVGEIVSAYCAIVAALTAEMYVRLRNAGLTDRHAAGILGIPPLPLLD